MPKSTVEQFDPSQLYPIPENVPVPVVLQACEQENVTFTYRQGKKAGQEGGFLKWKWTFLVDSGKYAGVQFDGSTEPKVTDSTQQEFLPLARPLVEALLGRPLQIGEEVDTDLLVGLHAVATVRHQDPRPRKNGDGFWYNVELNEIFPATGAYAPQGAPATFEGQGVQQYVQQGQQYAQQAQEGWGSQPPQQPPAYAQEQDPWAAQQQLPQQPQYTEPPF